MPLVSIIARNSRRLRDDRDLSLAVLAGKSGLSKQTIIDLEAARSNPTIETLERLADALGVSVRALISEMGNEVLLQSSNKGLWREEGSLMVRNLDQVYGSGYVYNALVRIEADKGVARYRLGMRGMLRHCYVIEGRVELGPDGRTIEAGEGDFIRFPGEGAHLFRSLTSTSLLFIVSTLPQQSIRGTATVF